MIRQPSSWWLEGTDTVVLSGESVRRAYAAMYLAVRDARRKARRNGVPFPEEMVQLLQVLRLAADAARGGDAGAGGDRPASPVGSVGEPVGSAASPVLVPSVDAELVGGSLMDAKQIADSLDTTVEYARRLCRDRFKSARRVGREWRVSTAEVEVFAAAREQKRSA